MNKLLKGVVASTTLALTLALTTTSAFAVDNNPSECYLKVLMDTKKWNDGRIQPATHYINVLQSLPLQEEPRFTMYVMDSWEMIMLIPTKNKENWHLNQTMNRIFKKRYIGKMGTKDMTSLTGRVVNKDIWVEVGEQQLRECIGKIPMWPLD